MVCADQRATDRYQVRNQGQYRTRARGRSIWSGIKTSGNERQGGKYRWIRLSWDPHVAERVKLQRAGVYSPRE